MMLVNKKAAYRVSISRFFVHLHKQELLPSTGLRKVSVPPPNCIHCNHRSQLKLKTCQSKEKQAFIWFKKYQYGSYFLLLERRPHHGSHIVFVF